MIRMLSPSYHTLGFFNYIPQLESLTPSTTQIVMPEKENLNYKETRLHYKIESELNVRSRPLMSYYYN